MRTGRFQFHDPSLWWPRARLHADGLELTGWHWRGRYRRVLPLRQILQVDVPSDDGLLIWLASGETVRLRIKEASRWKTAIEVRQAGLKPIDRKK